MLVPLGISISMVKSSGFASWTGICCWSGGIGDGVGLLYSEGGLSSSFPSVFSLLPAPAIVSLLWSSGEVGLVSMPLLDSSGLAWETSVLFTDGPVGESV